MHILTKNLYLSGWAVLRDLHILQKIIGVRNWNLYFIVVLRRSLEKDSLSYQNSLTFPQLKHFLAYLSKGRGYPQIFQNMLHWMQRLNKELNFGQIWVFLFQMLEHLWKLVPWGETCPNIFLNISLFVVSFEPHNFQNQGDMHGHYLTELKVFSIQNFWVERFFKLSACSPLGAWVLPQTIYNQAFPNVCPLFFVCLSHLYQPLIG